jgi:hypothetical protein
MECSRSWIRALLESNTLKLVFAASPDKVISATVPCYGDQMLQSLHQLQQRGINCEVTLQAYNGSAYIHNIVLAAGTNSYIEHEQRWLIIDCTKYCILVVEAAIVLL